ncbi:hypothetical protein AVEN_191852-1 [Araneus ventricosus]|uniref:Uncharacterized protein n=1 Tax=Araneus ventricosus TaxID=182803 RepID=A0A4Y2EZP6_ARAVE|nr:hypothetical protein AVEN_191852-1 [Araneus ventricosus]
MLGVSHRVAPTSSNQICLDRTASNALFRWGAKLPFTSGPGKKRKKKFCRIRTETSAIQDVFPTICGGLFFAVYFLQYISHRRQKQKAKFIPI